MKEKSNYYFNDEYLPLSKKKEASEYLIRIIPEENMENKEENKDSNDDQIMQRQLFKVYQFFTGNDNKSYEIERNENNFQIPHDIIFGFILINIFMILLLKL